MRSLWERVKGKEDADWDIKTPQDVWRGVCTFENSTGVPKRLELSDE